MERTSHIVELLGASIMLTVLLLLQFNHAAWPTGNWFGRERGRPKILITARYWLERSWACMMIYASTCLYGLQAEAVRNQ